MSKRTEVIFVLEDGEMFKNIFNALAEFTTDLVFNFDSEGLSIQGMDSSHVAMVAVFWKKSDFDHYYVTSKMSYGISLINLVKCLKLLPSKGNIQFSVDHQNNDILKIDMINNTCTNSLDLKLMNLDTDELTIPDISYNIVVKYKTTDFKNIINNIGDVTENIDFFLDSKKDIVIGGSGDVGEVECRITPIEGKISCDALKVKVSLRYVKMFIKVGSVAEYVNVRLDNDMPVNFIFQFKKASELVFFVAPKIMDDI